MKCKTEDQLKTDIFSIYTQYFNESSSDRRQTDFARIYDKIISWCIQYLNINANEMGLEIYGVVQRLIKNSNKKLLNDKNDFIRYLKKALNNAKKEYHRNIGAVEEDIPGETRRKLRLVKDLIAYKESYESRKITEAERKQYVSELFDPVEYSELLKLKNVSHFEFAFNNTDDESTLNLLDSEVKSIFTENSLTDPQEEYFTKLDGINDKEILEQILKTCQDRTRECYRSLFTAYCINNSKLKDELIALLDNEILEAFKENGNEPKLRDIYLAYHPEVQKESADVLSSNMLKAFRKRIQTARENSKKN